MKYFSRDWLKIKEKLPGKKIALFLDFDGTLTPIKKRPTDVSLPPKVRQILQKLSSLKGVYVHIVSGRELKDVKSRVGLRNLTYVGNHGLEIKGSKISFIKPHAKTTKPHLETLHKQLKKALKPISGAIVENKHLSLSIHYRLVPFFQMKELKKAFQEITEPFLAKKKIIITEGKKVWEIKPPVKWNKGEAVLWILKKIKKKKGEKIIPFYFGDDQTDEDAFASLKRNGYTIRVGHPKGYRSKAKYFLRNTEVVYLFLEELYHVLTEGN